jgi:hypothetical protein
MYLLARNEKLTVRELPEETMVYDLDRHKVHCLNRTAALVWRHCDGRHDLPALAAVVASALGLANTAATAAAQLALVQLGRRHLLQETPVSLAEQSLTRRAALRKLAATAAAALPLVMTLTSPSVAWAGATHQCTSDADCVAAHGTGSKCLPFGSHFSSTRCVGGATTTAQ